jgi:hypothetical protein
VVRKVGKKGIKSKSRCCSTNVKRRVKNDEIVKIIDIFILARKRKDNILLLTET